MASPANACRSRSLCAWGRKGATALLLKVRALSRSLAADRENQLAGEDARHSGSEPSVPGQAPGDHFREETGKLPNELPARRRLSVSTAGTEGLSRAALRPGGGGGARRDLRLLRKVQL